MLKDPTRVGYDFVGWIGNNVDTPSITVVIDKGRVNGESKEWTEDLSFKAIWEPRNDTKLTIRYCFESIDGNSWDCSGKYATDTIYDNQTSDNIIETRRDIKEVKGFTYQEDNIRVSSSISSNSGWGSKSSITTVEKNSVSPVTQTGITADGSKVIYLFYTRNNYDVSLTNSMAARLSATITCSTNKNTITVLSSTSGTLACKYEEKVNLKSTKYTKVNESNSHFKKWNVTDDISQTITKESLKNPFEFILPANNVTLIVSSETHKYSTTTIDPWCTTKGYDRHKCSYCGYYYDDNYKNALGHNYSYWDEPVKCTGVWHRAKCTRCGNTDPTYHTGYDEHDMKVSSSKAATCTSSGYKTYTCSHGCGYTYTETLSALGHNYKLDSWKSATCTTNGYKTYKCSRCSDSYTNTINATGHKYEYSLSNSKPATCTSGGSNVYVCNKCGASYSTPTSALGHFDPGTMTTAAYYYCGRCGAKIWK